MIPGDYQERKRINAKGKAVTDKVIVSAAGNEYRIGPRMGRGGVAAVYRAKRLSDGAELAFKEYTPSKERVKIHHGIRRNLQKLIAKPILGKDGNPCPAFVPPIELIDLPKSRGFGYVMELVDTDRYTTVLKIFRDYPDARILCAFGKNIADLFGRLHRGSGWCYKDINEGNIYLDPKSGEVKVIDCDNISVPETKTIEGTPGYMAPEIYEDGAPNAHTDKFSMAVYFYRMLVGGYPMDGARTHAYLRSHEQCVQEAAPIIYGKQALFAFDPADRANAITPLMSGDDAEMYRLQDKLWHNLPGRLRQCFVKTFSQALHRPEARTTDHDWYAAFDEVQQHELVRCACGKYNFGSASEKKTCLFCGKPLPLLKAVPQPAGPTAQAAGTAAMPQQPAAAAAQELTTVVFLAKRDVLPKAKVTARRRQVLDGKSLHPALPAGSLLKLQYSPAKGQMAAVNESSLAWRVTTDGAKTDCPPGGRVVLKPGQVITVLYRQLQLTVKEIS